MRRAKSEGVFHAPLSWDEFPMGDWLAGELQKHLDLWCPRLFGYHLLKVGELSASLCCSNSSVRHQLSVGSELSHCSVQADLLHLPFLSTSIDACVLTHTLDFSQDPHQLLREIERVLTHDGYLVISGFNPFSLVGLGKLVWPLTRRLPWRARMFTPSRIKDWLNLLQFEVLEESHFGYSFLGRHSHVSWSTEGMGRRYLPCFSGVYVMLARKRRMRLTPVGRVKIVTRPVAVPGMVKTNVVRDIPHPLTDWMRLPPDAPAHRNAHFLDDPSVPLPSATAPGGGYFPDPEAATDRDS